MSRAFSGVVGSSGVLGVLSTSRRRATLSRSMAMSDDGDDEQTGRR